MPAVRLALLVALAAAAVLAVVSVVPHEARAALMDDETPPLPPQYYDWDHAFDLTPADAGTVIPFRRDGGTDEDYLRFQGLNVGDLVSLIVDVDEQWSSTVDFFISDPLRFPIWYYEFDGSSEPLPLNFGLFVALPGTYYFHTGMGFGSAIINLSFTIAASGHTGDGNDRPEQASVLTGNATLSVDLDQPYDPSDFFKVHLAPSSSWKVFLTIKLLNISAGAAQWELYDSVTVKRPSKSYAGDILFQDLPNFVEYAPILREDDYYLRVWMRLGSGNVKLSLLVFMYPNDGNDDNESSREVRDGDVVMDHVNTKFDQSDYYKIALVPHDNLSLWLEVDDDADLFLFYEGGKIADSMKFNDTTEHLRYEVPDGTMGWFYILIKPYNLDTGLPPHTIHYTLRVRTNLDPVAYPAAAGLVGVHPLWEDTVDSTIDLGLLFSDPEGGPLSYRVVGGFNTSLLNVTISGTRLRISPAPNASGFEDVVTVEAIDDHGNRCDYTISLYVVPVDDPPQVGPPGALAPPASIELDEDGTSEPFEPIRWFWDVDDPFWDLSISVLAESPLEASLKGDVMTVRAALANWWGSMSLRVVASDPAGLMATLVMTVHVLPVNDPPEARTASLLLTANSSSIDIDLMPMFRDVDGDVLSYVIADVGVPTVVRDSILTVTDLKSRQGTRVELEVTAVDPSGVMSAPVRIAIWVPEVPDPPVVGMSTSEFTVVEGSELVLLRLSVSDPDPLPRTYTVVVRAEGWEGRFGMDVSSTGVTWPDGPPSWTPAVRRQARDAAGTVTVIDGPFNATVGFLAHVVRLNHAPEVKRILLDRDGNYRAGDSAVAQATVADADSDPLTYRWFLDGRAVPGEGARLRVEELTAGLHHVLLNVTDGCATGENTASFYVRSVASPTDSSAPVAIAVGLAASVAVAVALVTYVSRRRRGKGGA
jgi:hypothetical protein